MQLVPRYLVKNQTTVISNDSGLITEYRPVYSRQLKIYKGIDNTLDFRVLNADQKPVSIIGKVPVIMIFDEKQRLVIKRDCNILETTTPSKVGMFNVTITENDMLNLKQQYLSYSVHLEGNGKELTYSSSYFDNKGTIYLDGQSMPAPLSSVSISTFSEETENNWCSESVDAEPTINGNSALHTVALYLTNNYTGDITVQGTLDNEIVGTTQWADIKTVSYENKNTVEYINFNGIFSHIRVCSNSNPANTISKILIRN